ncbi:MAG: hypothetical protein RSG58_07640, partial [Eubacterium sp.]
GSIIFGAGTHSILAPVDRESKRLKLNLRKILDTTKILLAELNENFTEKEISYLVLHIERIRTV